jgi:hypothetical protein
LAEVILRTTFVLLALGVAACGSSPGSGVADAPVLQDAPGAADAASLAPDAPTGPTADAATGPAADAAPLVEVPLPVRYATLQAIGQKFDALEAQGLAPMDVVTQTAAFAMTQPGVAVADVDADSISAWGRFTDGRIFVLPDNYTLVRDPNRPAVAPFAATVLPQPAQSRILTMLGLFEIASAIGAKISTWLSDAGYPDVGVASTGMLPELRSLSGDGLFYFSTHGGRGGALGFDNPFPAVETSSDVLDGAGHTIDGPWTEFQDSYKATDLDAANHLDLDAVPPRIVYMRGKTWDTDPPTRHWRYAITSAFVDKYMSFGPNAVVVLNACTSADVPSWASVFLRKGAAAYVGWHGFLTAPDGYDMIQALVDKMVGGNQFKPMGAPGRPWDIASVWLYMQAKGYDTSSKGWAQLYLAASPPILLPSIKQLSTDVDKKVVVLDGEFGDQPGKITMDDTELVSAGTWSSTRVEAKLPDTGAGAHGAVQVAIGQRKSNQRVLTHWDGTVTYTETRFGSEQVKITMSLSLGADVGKIRDMIDDDAYGPVLLDVRANQASTASFSAGGSGAGCSLSGGAALPWKPDPKGTWFRVLARIDTVGKVMRLELMVNDLQAVTTKCGDAMTTAPLMFSTEVFDGTSATGDTVYLDLPMDDTWSVAPDSRTATKLGWGYTEKIEWNGFSAQSIPDPNQPS